MLPPNSTQISRKGWGLSITPQSLDTNSMFAKCLGESQRIADRISARLLHMSDKERNWLNQSRVGAEHCQLEWLDDTLYEGWPGLVLFLAQFDALNKTERYAEIISLFLEPYIKKIRAYQSNQLLPMGRSWGLSGIGGDIYFLLSLGHLQNQHSYFTDAALLIDCFPQHLIAKWDNFNVLNGMGGLLLTLLKLAPCQSLLHQQKTLELAKKIGMRLLEACQYDGWPEKSPITQNNGFIQGNGGVLLALAQLFDATADTGYRHACQELLLGSNYLIKNENIGTPDSIWYKDLPEIGVALLGLYPIMGDGEMAATIRTIAEICICRGKTHNETLCCETTSQIDFLVSASKIFGVGRWHLEALKLAIEALSVYCSQYDNSELDLSLYLGLSGFGYQLLRINYPEYVDSILLWE